MFMSPVAFKDKHKSVTHFYFCWKLHPLPATLDTRVRFSFDLDERSMELDFKHEPYTTGVLG
jgi:hypothetical protein